MSFKKILIAALVTAATLPMAGAHANTITFTTAQSEFTPDTLNQGWWAAGVANSTTNDNHITGTYSNREYRSFYTFDLTNITGTVKSASLLIQAGNITGNNIKLNLWDVTTAANIVNNNAAANAAVFADLGSGNSYGSYTLAAANSKNKYLTLDLNTQAFNDIGTANGFFTIGATAFSAQSNYIFGATSGDVTRLIVEFADAPVNKVPEPASLGLLLAGIGGLVAARRRKQ